MLLHSLISFGFCLAVATSKNILLTNDDSWAATNIRSTYQALKDAGHNVLLVAPASQRSGWSSKFDIPPVNTLQTDGEFEYIKQGDPAWGHEENDMNIWYFNGTPASSVAFALEYVIPTYFSSSDENNQTAINNIDLVVSGPNEGLNLSPGTFVISGTVGATVASVFRGLPAIAFSASNTNNSFFKDSLNDDPLEPANIYAKKVAEFVNTLFEKQGANDRALPLGVGLTVNLPKVGYESTDESCTDPSWVFTRITGAESAAPNLLYDAESNLVKSNMTKFEALTVCYNGDCTLPSEASIIADDKCQTAVSVFSIDFDANAQITENIHSVLGPLFQ